MLGDLEITCVTVDCADPDAIAEFWNEALRWGGVAASPDGSGRICGPRVAVCTSSSSGCRRRRS